MKILRVVFFIASVYGQSDVYWGSYELNIPGGSGSGNAVQDLKLPENAPEFFQFAAFNSQPVAAPQFNPVDQAAPRPTQQTVLIPVPQPAPQVRPSPQPQQLRVFQSESINRQQQRQRPAQIRKPAPQPAPRPAQSSVLNTVQNPAPRARPNTQPQQLRVIQPQQRLRPARIPQPAPKPSPVQQESTQRFENFAARKQERRPSPVVQAQPPVKDNEVDIESESEDVVDVSNLSRFQLYQLRQKLKLQKEAPQVEAIDLHEITTQESEDIQETPATTVKIVPKGTRTGIRRKAVRRKLVRNLG